MHNTWNKAEQCQKDINPEMLGQADFQKDAQRRQEDGEQDFNEIGKAAMGRR